MFSDWVLTDTVKERKGSGKAAVNEEQRQVEGGRAWNPRVENILESESHPVSQMLMIIM